MKWRDLLINGRSPGTLSIWENWPATTGISQRLQINTLRGWYILLQKNAGDYRASVPSNCYIFFANWGFGRPVSDKKKATYVMNSYVMNFSGYSEKILGAWERGWKNSSSLCLKHNISFGTRFLYFNVRIHDGSVNFFHRISFLTVNTKANPIQKRSGFSTTFCMDLKVSVALTTTYPQNPADILSCKLKQGLRLTFVLKKDNNSFKEIISWNEE